MINYSFVLQDALLLLLMTFCKKKNKKNCSPCSDMNIDGCQPDTVSVQLGT